MIWCVWRMDRYHCQSPAREWVIVIWCVQRMDRYHCGSPAREWFIVIWCVWRMDRYQCQSPAREWVIVIWCVQRMDRYHCGSPARQRCSASCSSHRSFSFAFIFIMPFLSRAMNTLIRICEYCFLILLYVCKILESECGVAPVKLLCRQAVWFQCSSGFLGSQGLLYFCRK